MRRTVIAGACALALGAAAPMAHAQSNQELKQQIEALQKQIDVLRTRLDTPPPVAVAPAPAGGEFIQRKPGKGVTFLTRGGELSLYGNLDLSLDDTTKGINGMVAPDGSRPVGNGGWMPAIASNSSYVGLRGFQTIGSLPTRFVWQLETQLDVSVTSGWSQSNSNTSSSVKGGLTSRNSFIGLANNGWGAVKIGKTDTPYKTATSPLNPFASMLGDYSVIMGNSGGDNRVEFGSRLDHSIWYESPVFSGFSFNALFSPGQNRAGDSSNLASGEGDCTGGNIPGSGGGPQACNDGAFGNAYSLSLKWRRGPLYLTGAYELHKKVNRTSDLPTWDAGDVADESAVKVGAQYRLGTGTTLNAIFEHLKRDVPDRLQYQNERSRNGFWLALSQNLGFGNSVHFGWAHAGRTPGDPGQHNTLGGANPDNTANMFTLAWKHQVDPSLSYYVDYATTINHRDAHFDLGAGGHGVTTDCHDASNPDTSGFDPNGGAPKCWAGGHLQGVSVGMRYQF